MVSNKCPIIGKTVAVIFFYITGYHSNNVTAKTALKFNFKVVWYPKMDQKVCLNMARKDQLCAITPLQNKIWL